MNLTPGSLPQRSNFLDLFREALLILHQPPPYPGRGDLGASHLNHHTMVPPLSSCCPLQTSPWTRLAGQSFLFHKGAHLISISLWPLPPLDYELEVSIQSLPYLHSEWHQRLRKCLANTTSWGGLISPHHSTVAELWEGLGRWLMKAQFPPPIFLYGKFKLSWFAGWRLPVQFPALRSAHSWLPHRREQTFRKICKDIKSEQARHRLA